MSNNSPKKPNKVYSVLPKCGCTIEGLGAITDPLRIKFCELHSQAQAMYEQLEQINQIFEIEVTKLEAKDETARSNNEKG